MPGELPAVRVHQRSAHVRARAVRFVQHPIHAAQQPRVRAELHCAQPLRPAGKNLIILHDGAIQMLHSFSSPKRLFARRFRSCSARPAFSFYHIFHRRAISLLRRVPQKAASRQRILSMNRRSQVSDIQHVFPNALKAERLQDVPRRRSRSCPSRPRLCIHRAGRSAPREAPPRGTRRRQSPCRKSQSVRRKRDSRRRFVLAADKIFHFSSAS